MGSTISWDGKATADIKCSIVTAKKVIIKKIRMLTSRNTGSKPGKSHTFFCSDVVFFMGLIIDTKENEQGAKKGL